MQVAAFRRALDRHVGYVKLIGNPVIDPVVWYDSALSSPPQNSISPG
jgi:hypothetical protein